MENYTGLYIILDLCKYIIEKLNDNSIVIAPGDSPFKIIQLINMLYQTEPETYVYQIKKKIIYKHIKFVMFPISGLSDIRTVPKNILDDYMNQVWRENNITSFDNLIYLDYSAGGGSYFSIYESLVRLTGNKDLKLEKINPFKFWKALTSINEYRRVFFDIIAESD